MAGVCSVHWLDLFHGTLGSDWFGTSQTNSQVDLPRAQAVLYIVLPGRTAYGVKLRNGTRLPYSMNGTVSVYYFVGMPFPTHKGLMCVRRLGFAFVRAVHPGLLGLIGSDRPDVRVQALRPADHGGHCDHLHRIWRVVLELLQRA